ncbi:MAG: FAD binding domain-containing protein, partial [Bdellovibrionaceae bacterium]|nr:FAD binding domain-containing protein [Pseudobdellovibrionaceae bacterium]
SLLPGSLVDEMGKLRIDAASFSLGEGLFAGGDFVSGPATVAEAISHARKAARAICEYLGTTLSVGESGDELKTCGDFICFDANCLGLSARVQIPSEALYEGRSLMAEEVRTLDAEAVLAETKRCFNCGCAAVNSSDLAPALVVLAAKVKTNKRTIPMEEFFSAGINTSTVLAADEMILEIEIPRPPASARSAFMKFALRKSIDFPIVNCAALIDFEGDVVKTARLCLNSVYCVPLRLELAEKHLVGKVLDEMVAEEAAELAVAGAQALTNNRYKIQIARALVKRTILACVS